MPEGRQAGDRQGSASGRSEEDERERIPRTGIDRPCKRSEGCLHDPECE